MNNLVLLDVFSYSCMNCLRSLQFIKNIDEKYRKSGLKTVLVHPPEWNFEKSSHNIINALKKNGINLPLVVDKNKKIIKKFNVDFWPAQILVREGKVVYRHVGEGNYKHLENKIRKILGINSKALFKKEPKYSKFPAIYLGKKKNGKVSKLKSKISFGTSYIEGKWLQKDECLVSKDNVSLSVLTKGNTVNFVAKSINKSPINIKIFLDSKIINSMRVKDPRLYQLIALKNKKQRILTIKTSKNLAVYSFSFQ